MSVTDEEIAFVRDLFADIGDIKTRKMFGGLAIYSGDTIFAMIGPGNKILIKAKGDLADALKDDGGEQFVYDGHKDKVTAMPYWSLPEAALDDPELACDWARKSLEQNAT